jgi:hypothetical protein
MGWFSGLFGMKPPVAAAAVAPVAAPVDAAAANNTPYGYGKGNIYGSLNEIYNKNVTREERDRIINSSTQAAKRRENVKAQIQQEVDAEVRRRKKAEIKEVLPNSMYDEPSMFDEGSIYGEPRGGSRRNKSKRKSNSKRKTKSKNKSKRRSRKNF